MKREQLTERLLDAKREKGWRWKRITDEIGGISPVHKSERALARQPVNAIYSLGVEHARPQQPGEYEWTAVAWGFSRRRLRDARRTFADRLDMLVALHAVRRYRFNE